MKICSVEGCDRKVSYNSMCGMHVQRKRAAEMPRRSCACGCGEQTKATFVAGHHTRLLPAEEQSRRGRMNTGDKQRDTGCKDGYRKVGGRHEHRRVAEEMLGRELQKGEIVHHKNGNKKDNRPENLEVMTQSEHINAHRAEMHEARMKRRART